MDENHGNFYEMKQPNIFLARLPLFVERDVIITLDVLNNINALLVRKRREEQQHEARSRGCFLHILTISYQNFNCTLSGKIGNNQVYC